MISTATLRAAGVASTLAVPVALGVHFLAGPSGWQVALAALALAALLILLLHAWQLAGHARACFSNAENGWIRIHLAGHAIPLGLMAWFFLTGHLAASSPLWSAAFVLFFYSGRRTWHCLHALFGRPLYFIFKRGNSAVLIMTLLLTIIGSLLPSLPAASLLKNILSLYTSIHLTLIAVAVIVIDKDLNNA